MSSILESPELCHALSPYLSSHDLAQCARLNKPCHSVWLPYLWRHVEFADFQVYLADLFPDLHKNGIPPPPPSSSTQRERRLTEEAKRERAVAAAEVTETYLSKIRSPPYEQLLRYRHLVQSMTFHVDESDAPYASPYTDPNIVENLKGQVRRRVFVALIENAGTNLRALEIKGFNTLHPDRPQLGECGFAAMQRSAQRSEQWALDHVVATLITTAAKVASSPAEAPASTSTIDVTITNGDKNDKSTDQKPRTYSSGSNRRGCGLRFLSMSRMLGMSTDTIKAIIQVFSTKDSSLEHVDIQSCGGIQSEHIHMLLESLPTLQFLDVRCRELETGVPYACLEAYSGLMPKEYCPEDVEQLPWSRLQQQPQNPDPLSGVWACAGSLRVLRIGVSATWDYDIGPLTVLELLSQEETDMEEERYKALEITREHAFGYVTWSHAGGFQCTNATAADRFDWFFAKVGTLTRLQELSLVNVQPLYFRS
ncbi:hypothetical protein EMPS_06729 [Entomortierella parvispora]|uniref:Uncharacterized protein n=1 Tax=Entomortierella parvispora TaxID=205924 RepID=A0A9P3HD16_9FUNG|nr:hypothetical protein EMPS_06729 [Entomortierella parvispora]